MIYVQHLLGVGHLQRARQLAMALAQQGFRVELVTGGMPRAGADIPGVNIHQLPPTYCADASFSLLLDANGREIDETWRDGRRTQLLDLFDRLSPRVLITETFPFGRRMLRFELMPLLAKARASAQCQLVISSIRDMLQPKSNPGRNQEILALVEQYYDHVIVHGDPAVARLEDSFESAAVLRDKIFYSGYISQIAAAPIDKNDAHGEVLVSAGGSGTGLRILETAIGARASTRLAHIDWRILVSPAIDDADFRRLRQLAVQGIIVERNRADFTDLMRHASLSISQAGYNTVTDILGARIPAVVIPFADSGEIEQTLRAQRLQACGRLAMLEAHQLSTAKLATAVDHALELDTFLAVDLDGATNSAAQIATWLAALQP